MLSLTSSPATLPATQPFALPPVATLATPTLPCMGASQVEAGLAIPRHRVAPTFAAPMAALFGPGTQAASQAKSAQQQLIDNKYAHTARIAPTGGEVGSHPARDPV